MIHMNPCISERRFCSYTLIIRNLQFSVAKFCVVLLSVLISILNIFQSLQSKIEVPRDVRSSGKISLNIRTNASPKWDRTRCPEE